MSQGTLTEEQMMDKPQVQVGIELPMSPNFIRLTHGGTKDIALMSDDELQRIGEAWTKELIRRAHKRRESL